MENQGKAPVKVLELPLSLQEKLKVEQQNMQNINLRINSLLEGYASGHAIEDNQYCELSKDFTTLNVFEKQVEGV